MWSTRTAHLRRLAVSRKLEGLVCSRRSVHQSNYRTCRLQSDALRLWLSAAAAVSAAVATFNAVSQITKQDITSRPQNFQFLSTTATCCCDKSQPQQPSSTENIVRLHRKRTTLQAATATKPEAGKEQSSSSSDTPPRRKKWLQRFSTQQELDKLREHEQTILKRWEDDEEGWRELPARAWPAYQPNPEQLKGILAELAIHGCESKDISKADLADVERLDADTRLCAELWFDMATSFVFHNMNPKAGLDHYDRLAKHGHVDSMVACGIVLVEGLGVPPNEKEGLRWLHKAAKRGSAQAYYELGTCYYTGIDGVLEEDDDKAFALFEKAAEQDHTAALYMVADCLVEGVGTEKSLARAIPLFYKAAERGHRFSRQRIRELLARIDYPL